MTEKLAGTWSNHDFQQPHGGDCVDSLICRVCRVSWNSVHRTDRENKCQYYPTVEDRILYEKKLAEVLEDFSKRYPDIFGPRTGE